MFRSLSMKRHSGVKQSSPRMSATTSTNSKIRMNAQRTMKAAPAKGTFTAVFCIMTYLLVAGVPATPVQAQLGAQPSPTCGGSWKFEGPSGYVSLNSVAAVSPIDVWAVGDVGIIRHWNGQDWTNIPNPK